MMLYRAMHDALRELVVAPLVAHGSYFMRVHGTTPLRVSAQVHVYRDAATIRFLNSPATVRQSAAMKVS
jgi:hypothetical protein